MNGAQLCRAVLAAARPPKPDPRAAVLKIIDDYRRRFPPEEYVWTSAYPFAGFSWAPASSAEPPPPAPLSSTPPAAPSTATSPKHSAPASPSA